MGTRLVTGRPLLVHTCTPTDRYSQYMNIAYMYTTSGRALPEETATEKMVVSGLLQ